MPGFEDEVRVLLNSRQITSLRLLLLRSISVLSHRLLVPLEVHNLDQQPSFLTPIKLYRWHLIRNELYSPDVPPAFRVTSYPRTQILAPGVPACFMDLDS
jgi:hypothetical protein